jgi:hypothetical protein
MWKHKYEATVCGLVPFHSISESSLGQVHTCITQMSDVKCLCLLKFLINLLTPIWKAKKINNARTPFFKANFAIEEERNWLMEATSKIIIFILFLSQPKNIILIEVVSFSKLPNQDIHHQRTLSSFPTSNRRSLCTSYSKFTFVSNMKKCSSSYQPSRMFVRRFFS